MSPLPFALLVLFAGCEVAHTEPAKPPPEASPDARVRYHMRENLGQLRTIERLLIRGKLDEAKALARRMGRASDSPGASAWARHATRVRELAAALANSPTVDEACKREARLAMACSQCHDAAGALVDLEAPRVPADASTLAARMTRHVWATDRLWEAMIGGPDDLWLKGLDVLAQTPLPFPTSQDGRAGLARRLQQLADRARLGAATTTRGQRAERYGEILIVCASCHSAQKAITLPSQR